MTGSEREAVRFYTDEAVVEPRQGGEKVGVYLLLGVGV